MEQKDYRDIPGKITKKLTKVVPAAVSTTTSALSSLTLEHHFKDVLRKARKKLGGHGDDAEETKRIAEVDNLIVLDDGSSIANDQSLLGKRNDGANVKDKPKAKAKIKSQLPYSSPKPHSTWHISLPISDIIDQPVKPVYPTTYSQPIVPKATEETRDDSSSATSKLAPDNHQLRDTGSLHVDNRPVLLPGDTIKPVPLPRKSLRLTSETEQVVHEPSDSSTGESRPQSQPEFAPIPLPRKRLNNPPSKPSSVERDLPSYRSLFGAALAVENPGVNHTSGVQRSGSSCSSQAEDTTTNECSICFVSSRDHATIPCGHIYCEECAQHQLKTRGVCYTCEQDIIMVTKVYIN